MSTTKSTTKTVVWPTLRYRDANAAIRFLVDVLGFEEAAIYRADDPNVVEHAELRWPEGGGVMLGSDHRDSSIADLPPGTGSVYVVTNDPDAVYARAQGGGANITREMTEEDYGSRGFTMRDPEGVFWSFGTYGGVSSGSS